MHEIAPVHEFCTDPDVFFKFLLHIPHAGTIDLSGFGLTVCQIPVPETAAFAVSFGAYER